MTEQNSSTTQAPAFALDEKGLGIIQLQKDHALLRLNPSIYPLDLIYSAAYIMIDTAFILFDGDPSKEIRVEIRKKNQNQQIEELVMRFNEELLTYAVYKIQSEKNKHLREIILSRALLTNTQIQSGQNTQKETPTKD